MEIFIPSSGRPFRQTTWGKLPPSLRERAMIVVPEKEVDLYREANAGANVIPVPLKGIGPTRQWCIDAAQDKMVMLDDDLTFFHRREDDAAKFREATLNEVESLVKSIEWFLELHTHVGVATREGGNRNTEDVYINNRMLRVLAYRADTLRGLGIRFDRVPVMEDFDVTLSLLRLGHSNTILNHMVHDQHGSNLAGGCSQYRDDIVQRAGATGLKELHGPFVAVVEKITKTAWGGKPRTDVRIQWKKAYESAFK